MKYLYLAIGILISVVCLYFAFRGVQFEQVGAALRAARYPWLVPAVACIVASLVLRAVRWRLLFAPTTGLRLGNVFGAMNAGYLVNTVLPFRLGEVARAVLLSRFEPVSVPRAISTVAVERVLDLLTTIIALALLIPFVPLPAGSALPLALATALVVFCLLVMIVAGTRPRLTHRLARLFTDRLPASLGERLHALIDQFLQGFAVLARPREATAAVLLSVPIFLLLAAALWCCMLAFDLRLPPSAPMFVLALVSLSFIVPSPPGHIGVFHLTTVKALEIGFDVNPDLALSYALVTHVVSFAPPTLLGAWFLWRASLSLSGVLASSRAAEHAPAPTGAGDD